MWGPMMSYGYGGWGWMMALNGLFWIILVVGVLALILRVARPAPGPGAAHSNGLDALEERYARGEIQRDEFLQKKRDILGADPAAPSGS